MITPLPTPPSRANPEGFSVSADAFLGALPAFGDEANVLQADVNAKQLQAAASQVAAAASQAAAEAASNATAWVSGTTYAVGNVRYSPINFKSYRRKTAGAGTTDPSADSTNWQLLTGLGDVDLSSTQTLTNKTFSTGSVWDGVSVSISRGGTSANTAAGAVTALGAVSATANQTISGVKTFSDVLRMSSAAESQVIAVKTGTGASEAYLFNNATTFGIFDTVSGNLIARQKGGNIEIGGDSSTTFVANNTAGLGTGAVGTYALMKEDNSNTRAPGSTLAGSSLQYSNALGSPNTGVFGSGTWRCMGQKNGGGSASERVTLWLRIS